MNKFCIFMILLVSCLLYDYNDGAYYRPRIATITLFSLPTSFERTSFGRTPFGKPPFRNRLRAQLYRENHYSDRPDHTPAAWLRQVNAINTKLPKHPNSSLSDYGFIKNGQNKAKVTDNSKWKWIARVSPTNDNENGAPMLCTAACINVRIFITAAICIYKAKLIYTRVVYQDQELPPIAFVLPSKQTKEMFDDIGIIVVDSHTFNGTWHTNKISPLWMRLGRPDDQFVWHAKPEHEGPWHDGRVIGYVSMLKREIGGALEIPANIVNFTLYELDVKVSNFLCNYLYTKKTPSDAYFVPCYSVCNLMEHSQKLPKCSTYLSGMGHIVVWGDTNTLIGVATWAGYYKSDTSDNPPLPVGLSIANSKTFKDDLACAVKIRNAPNTTGRFVRLCK